MRPVILPTLATAFAVAMLAACGTGEEGKAGAAESGPAQPPASSASSAPAAQEKTLQVSETPVGKWSGKGSICKIIPVETVGKVLGVPTPTGAEFDRNDMPANRGLDTCTYSLADGTNVTLALKETSAEGWATARKEIEAAGGYEKVAIEGTDGGYVGHLNRVLALQAVIKKGDLLASGLNDSEGATNDGLAKLTALVLLAA
ncbi:hypothetical protein [Actinomadura chokoriensis]|uniref:hypothetical protein n=1 Tax=Actinomadura chokoriensis TaxID=454156 RepID=UPI0031F81D8E